MAPTHINPPDELAQIVGSRTSFRGEGLMSSSSTKRISLKLFCAALSLTFLIGPWRCVAYSQSVRSFGAAPGKETLSETAEAMVKQGRDLLEKDEVRPAIDILGRAVKQSPSDSVAHYYLGYALWKASSTDL